MSGKTGLYERISIVAPLIIACLDKNHEIVMFNKGAEKITGYKESEVTGKDWFSLFFKKEQHEEMINTWEKAWGKARTKHINPIYVKNGERKLIAWSNTFFKEYGKNGLLICIGTDITYKEKEEKRIEEARTNFTNIAVHELRSPLMNIVGLSDLLLNEKFGSIPAKAKKPLKTILSEANKIKKHTDNLLMSERIKHMQESFEIQKLHVADYLQKIKLKLKLLTAKYKKRLRITNKAGNSVFYADPDKLEQVFTNLVHNSSKYSAPNELIKIHASKEKNKMVFKVIDQGEGISNENQRNLFKKFTHKKDYLTRKQEGLGLGLYISKNILEQMHGTIKCKTKVGKGTTMIFALPRKKPKV
ncbi:MAG: PAS domain-containing sensor histidine kinase [Candidatus Undinarchaeales archaeon]